MFRGPGNEREEMSKVGEKILMNRGWRFHLGDVPFRAPRESADYMGYDDSGWREVTLPHDWSVEHPFDRGHSSGTGYLPGGTAWYRRHFTLPENLAGKRVRVTFGGVYRHARLWINSNPLGSQAYGYSTFTYDLTPFVRPGENVLCVRVEHEETADSRWFTGSGIYRDVTLDISGMRCFKTDGLFVTTPDLNTVRVAYETCGASGADFTVLDGEEIIAEAHAEGEAGEAALRVENARPWSPEDPHLYTLRARTDEDEEIVRFGIRTIRFDAEKGFFLNGVSRKLKGVCVHHDAGCLGAAVPKAVWERRLRKLKACGANALRTSHNPPDSHLLDLCDELGLLVQDEAFDEWEGPKNKWWQGHNVYPPKRYGYAEDFPQWHKIDLEGMIRRDRNHPCVIMWSIGNEIDYPNDPYVTPLFSEVLGNNDANKPAAERMYDANKPDAGRLATVAKELVDIVHALDRTRPVTSALSFPELSTRTGYADVLDASGYNYKEQFYEEDHIRFPDRVIYGSENGHSVSAWRAVLDHEYICGQFLWTGVDFLGECAGWPVRISQAGLLDLCGNEKPLYYLRKALWTEAPFCKISVAHRWRDPHNPERSGFHGIWGEKLFWDGQEGERVRVCVATNQGEAELFLNGVSLGRKEVSLDTEQRAVWELDYVPGELRAVVPGAEDTLTSTTGASVLQLTPDRACMRANGQDVIQVEITLRDALGRVAAAHDADVTYQILGDACILGIENGAPADLTPYPENHRKTWAGRAICYLRAGTMAEDITLRAFTRTGLTAQITLHQV